LTTIAYSSPARRCIACGKTINSESVAPPLAKVVELNTVELGKLPVTVRIATSKGRTESDLAGPTSMLTPVRVPVSPAVNVWPINLQHSLITVAKLDGEVKDWSTIGTA
jgi:hypothetical protein